MRSNRTTLRAAAVLGGAAVVVVLAGSLVSRAAGRIVSDARLEAVAMRPLPVPVEPAAGRVPAPKPLRLEDVPTPRCWSCPRNRWAETGFDLDLDHLAPLGDGPSNVARWLASFATDGAGSAPGRTYETTEVEFDGVSQTVLAFGDPLLDEIEPWLAQGVCRFYPDVWELDGLDTPIPNLQLVIRLARTFALRGRLADDPEAAREDFRRAIRLGRLLLQEDVTLIQNLVGIACVRMGVEALLEQARGEGDLVVVAAAFSVLADHDAMRSRAAARVSTATRLWSDVVPGRLGGFRLRDDSAAVDAVVEMARESKERALRFESLFSLRAIAHLGSGEQAAAARAALGEVAAGDDPLLARHAREALEVPFTDEELQRFVEEASR
jgi:hypothetical protein